MSQAADPICDCGYRGCDHDTELEDAYEEWRAEQREVDRLLASE